MIKKSVFVLCGIFLLQFVVAAQQPVAPVSYENLLEKVKKQDPAVSFKELRFAYTETKQYSPYGGDSKNEEAMFAALKAAEYEKALASSEKILAANYLDINAHFGAFAANRHLERSEKADYHRYVVQNLLKSITDSGDGKTMETAFFVISVDEEYAWFHFMGLQPSGHSKIEENGHSYDRMTAIDPKTKQSSIYFFNIDKPYNWLVKSLKN
ncbi:MAG TPA: DUF4919 domain-containing protein [Pyrinomonadaceae bacterium]